MGTGTDLDPDSIISGMNDLKRVRTDLDDIKKVKIDFRKAHLPI